MFGENIFEGWLSMPSMEGLLNSSDDSFEQSPTATSSNLQRARDASVRLTPTAEESPRGHKDGHADDPAGRKRRGHTKSRLGCVQCKKRKIKCQETWPSCANCVKRGCSCRYPTVFKHTQHDRIVSEVALNTPRPFVKLSETATTFSALDMRLFHHFLVAAHPCIPYSQVPIWVRDIPTYSHKYNYLMEAILALSGSHLSIFVDDVTDSAGLYHRQNAIKGLEEAFTRWPPKAEEAHVMLATSFLLAHQAGYMPDGIVDYILSLRGCAFLSQLIVANGLEGAFSVEPDLPRVWFSMTSTDRSSLDQSLVGDALLSLSGIVHLLDSPNVSRIEKAFFATLCETIQPLRVLPSQPSPEGTPSKLQHSPMMGEPDMQSTVSPVPSTSPESTFWESILPSGTLFEIRTSPTTQYPDTVRSINALMEALHILTTWPQEDVLRLLSPSNRIGMVIMAHFGAIRTIVATLCIPEAAMKIPVKAMVECSEKIVDAVVLDDDPDGEWAKYVEWPATIIRALRCCLNQKRGASLGDIFDLLKKDPGAFREGRPGRNV